MLCSPFPSPLYPPSTPHPRLGTVSYQCVVSVEARAPALAVSGELLYSAMQTGDIAVSQPPKLHECTRFRRGNALVKALLVTNSRIITAHDDGKIRVWRCRKARHGKFQLIGTLPSIKDYLMSFLGDKKYVEARRHHRQLRFQHFDKITALAVVPDGSLLFSASWDKTVKVWNLYNMRCIQSIKAHDDAVNDIAVGSDGFLCTASADNTVKVWSKLWSKVDRHALVSTLSGHKASVNALAIHPDGRFLFTGGSDGNINLWKREDGHRFLMNVAVSIQGHRLSVLCLAVSGSLLCSGSADKSIRVWRRESAGSLTCLAEIEGHKSPVKCLSISERSSSSCIVYSASLDSTVKAWAIDRHEEHQSLTARLPPSSSQALWTKG